MKKRHLIILMPLLCASLFAKTDDNALLEENAAAKKNAAENEETSTVQEQKPYDENLFSLVEANKERAEVERWRQVFLEEKRFKILKSTLESALEYRIYVRKTVRDRQLPPELEYLPVVESAYKTSVKSRSGAVGMWQFMSNSVAKYLRLNEYIDERYDPWISTKAGLSKLSDNYSRFNDWLIAIAAYNCGNGAMAKAISHGGTSDFWVLAEKGFLPKQTAEYIPQLLAVAEISSHPELFDADLPTHAEEYETMENERDGIFDYVPVKKAYMLSAIAKESGIPEKTLKHLNPALTKGFTPPAHSYEIRLPAGTKENVEEALSKIKPIEFPFKYKVVAGDSLWTISRRYGVTIQAICDTNGINENSIIRIGQILYIPASKK